MRFTTTVHRRDGPLWYFIPVLAAGFLPWTGYLWHAVRDALPTWKTRSERPVEMFLLLWVGIVFFFFSISDSKLPPYILPIFPPLAVLVGRVLGPLLSARDDLPLGRWFFAAVFGGLAIAVPVVYAMPSMRADDTVGIYLDAVAPVVFLLAVIFALGSLATIIAPRYFGGKATLVAIIVTAVLGWSGVSLVASIADPNSIKTAAEVINKYRKNGELVASVGTFFYDLPVYVNDKIAVVGNTAEFDFGMTQEDVSKYAMSTEDFSKHWNGKERVFMLVRTRLFSSWESQGRPMRMCVIARTERAVALSNWPIFDGDKMVCDPWYDLDDPVDFHPQGGDKVIRVPGLLQPSYVTPEMQQQESAP